MYNKIYYKNYTYRRINYYGVYYSINLWSIEHLNVSTGDFMVRTTEEHAVIKDDGMAGAGLSSA